MTLQEALDKQLLGRTIVKVDVEKQYTFTGMNLNVKLWFDDGSSMDNMLFDMKIDADESPVNLE